MRALVTGIGGFVGKYLRLELQNNGYEVAGLDVRPEKDSLTVDLLDADSVKKAVADIKPETVFHLAGQADVGASWRIPQKTFEINVIAAVNLLEAVRNHASDAKIVLVGSSDEYGKLGKAGESVTEKTELRPQSPYAVSKMAQEELAKVYSRAYNMNICMTRSFNHYGPGQREGFLIPDFASGIVRVEKGLKRCLKVGNLDSRRDFTHVRDVVRAYRLIAEKGRPGEVYNVGSGITYSVKEILGKLLTLAECPVDVVNDPLKMRPSDTPVICCNHNKLTKDTGWEPELKMDDMLSEVLEKLREII